MASTDTINNHIGLDNIKNTLSFHHIAYSIKHFFGLTEAARTERELNALSTYELNDIGLSRSDAEKIVKSMIAKEI